MLHLVTSMLWCPQGSLLSPLLFNIFMNDMNESVTVLSLCLYIKDTTQYAVDSSPFVLQYTLNGDMRNISSQLEHNYIVSSGQWGYDTRDDPFGNPSYIYDLVHVFNDISISLKKHLKIFGVHVHLENQLSFKDILLKIAYTKITAL